MDEGFGDRISELPHFIIHHIMSFLYRADVVRTGVLSKRWHNFWASFPILDFDQFHFEYVKSDVLMKVLEDNDDEETNMFFNHVDRSLSRFIEHKVRIRKFRLVVRLVNSNPSVYFLEKWLRLIVENNVEELDLWTYPSVYECFNLPPTIFAATSMKALILKDCRLEKPLCMETIKFVSLQRLSLETVNIDEQVLQHVISNCPLIEELSFIRCRGFKSIQVNRLHKLRRVTLIIKSCFPLESVDIKAPSLEYFHYTNKRKQNPTSLFNMSGCQNLRHLSLHANAIEDNLFNDLVSKFPLLEILEVSCCNMLERIKISNHHLKRFTIQFCKKLVMVNIDAPNLLLLLYNGDQGPIISSTIASSKWVDKLLCFAVHDVDWFLKLRVFFSRAHQFKVFTSNMSHHEKFFKIEEVQEISQSQTYEFEYLKLEEIRSSSNYPTLVDCLFWSCRPRTLSIVFKTQHEVNFAKCLCKELVPQEDINCCKSNCIKCWRHYLKDVKVEGSQGMEDERSNTLLDALPTLSIGQEICFKLEW